MISKVGDTVVLYCRACRYHSEHEVTEVIPAPDDSRVAEVYYTCNDCGEAR